MRYVDTYMMYGGLEQAFVLCPPLLGTLEVATSFEAGHVG